MSEMSKEPAPDSEKGLVLNVGEERIDVTPDNAVLYTFLGRTAIGTMLIENESVNHVFIHTGDLSDGRQKGLYLFEAHSEAYQTVAAFMMENNYPQVLNMRTVAECDLRAYLAEIDRKASMFSDQIPDFLPDDMT